MQFVQRSLRPVVRCLHANDDVRISKDRVGASLYVHVVYGLFESPFHTVANDVEERQHPHFGVFDDFFFLLQKRVCSSGPRIYDGRYARLQRQIRWNTVRHKHRVRVYLCGGGSGQKRDLMV